MPIGDPDDSLTPPPVDNSIPLSRRLTAVQSILEQGICSNREVASIVLFDTKSVYHTLVEACGIAARGRFLDPKVACWMLDPGAKEKNLHRMVTNYLPGEVHMLEGRFTV